MAAVVAAILSTIGVYNIHLYYRFHNNFSYVTLAQWRFFDDVYHYYERLGPTTTFVVAETPYALLSWVSFRTTHVMQPHNLVSFDAINPPKGAKMNIPSQNTVVVFLARADRANEVRAELKNADAKFHEILVNDQSAQERYFVFILGYHPAQ